MCALKRSLLAPAPFVSALGGLLSQLYDRGRRRKRGRGRGPGAQSNKTKNGSPFTMPRIYIISRNLRHFRSHRDSPSLARASVKEGRGRGRGGGDARARNGSEINLRGAAVFPGRPRDRISQGTRLYASGKSARGRLIGPMRHE